MAALVYICALAPDEDETAASQQAKFPQTDVFKYIEIAEGRVWLLPEGIGCFAGDLSPEEQQLVWATQGVPVADLFDQKVPGVAWKSKPSYYVLGNNDHTVHPELQRFVSQRMGATVFAVDAATSPCSRTPTSYSTPSGPRRTRCKRASATPFRRSEGGNRLVPSPNRDGTSRRPPVGRRDGGHDVPVRDQSRSDGLAPDLALDVICTAANAVHESLTTT